MAAVLALASSMSDPAAAYPKGKTSDHPSDVAYAARLISEYRRSMGLGAVVPDARLSAPARRQAQTLAHVGGLSHGDFAGRVRAFGIRGTAAENLAYGSPDVAGALAQWRGSSAHNANLLLPNARRIGLARADGGSTRYWVLIVAE